MLAFPIRFVLELFLKEYLSSVKVLFVLFASQIFYTIIRAVYVNLYKVTRNQKIYFIKLVFILFVGFAFNVIGYLILKNKESFAYGTLLSSIIWFVISGMDFKYLKLNIKEIAFIFLELFLFLLLGFWTEAIVGGGLYILISFILVYFLMNDTMNEIITNIKDFRR